MFRKKILKRMSDSDLIVLSKKQDMKAQMELYNRYYHAMFNTAFRIINNVVDAEDVMQEAFLSAFKKLEQYSGKATFGAWLKRIVVNRSLDFLKHKKEFVDIEELDVSDEFFSDVADDNVAFKIKVIKECLHNMPIAQRVILSLYLFEGYDHDEIASILNISAEASRARYSRAKRKLIENVLACN